MDQSEKPVPTEYETYYDDSEPASVQLPEDNYQVKTDGTNSYKKPITDRCIHSALPPPEEDPFQNVYNDQ